jgi:hypothetical protein
MNTLRTERAGFLAQLARVVACVIALNIAAASPASAKVLFHANFDRATANADYGLGQKEARPIPANAYKMAGTVDSGRWGRALNLTNGDANCTFDAKQNFDSKRGTVDFWFRIDKHEEGMYHPLFGWYRPPNQPGNRKRLSAFEVYLKDSVMTLGLHAPEYKGHSKAAPIEVGKWHHLEINWDCVRGSGKSAYNVLLDGKSVIRVEDGGALAGEGGRLHLGVWDYGWGHFLHGRIDELRITDQIEHASQFDPPTKPYAVPETIEYARETHQVAIQRLKHLDAEIESLMEFSGADGNGLAASVIRQSQVTAKGIERSLASLQSPLKADDPDVKSLCMAVDAAADQLSIARLPIHRISAEAAALAAKEDKRSLLFKDLNDELAGDAIILNGKQLFIDDYIIEEITGARRVLNEPVKPPRVADEPREEVLDRGSLMYDQEEQLFRMWYIVRAADLKKQLLCYATSTNGIDWKEPKTPPPLTLGDQIGFYDQGFGQLWFKHHTTPRDRCLATLRLDGFVSVDADGEATLITRRFIAIGDTLVVNAKADQGAIRVEAIDALGRVIKGFSKDDCKPITGDNVRHVVSWKGGSNCHPLQARPIKLRFHLKQAKLYSFEFQIRHNHFVPISYSQD